MNNKSKHVEVMHFNVQFLLFWLQRKLLDSIKYVDRCSCIKRLVSGVNQVLPQSSSLWLIGTCRFSCWSLENWCCSYSIIEWADHQIGSGIFTYIATQAKWTFSTSFIEQTGVKITKTYSQLSYNNIRKSWYVVIQGKKFNLVSFH